MPIHLQDNTAWEQVLKLFGIENAKVLSLDNGKLSFSAKTTSDSGDEVWMELSVKALKKALNDPNSMRAKVAHALPAAGDQAVEHKTIQKHEWTNLDPETLFGRIFKPELLQFLTRGKKNSNANLNTIHWEFSGKPFAIEKIIAETNMLMSAATDKATVLKILTEDNPSILLSDQDSCSEFAAEIFSVTQNDPNSLTVQFNQGLFLQELESIDESMGDTPAIAVKNREISIRIKPLLEYLHTTFHDLIVFNNDQGDLETLLSSQASSSNLSTPSRVQVLIDVSGSMSAGFEDYIKVIKAALIKAFETCPQLHADITPFNNVHHTYSFTDPTTLGRFLDTLTPGNGTNINCPLKEAYHNVSRNEHATVYLFTDGEGDDSCKEEDVTAAAITARQNPNMMSYSIEMGTMTDPLFFERLSNNTGFTSLAFANSTQAIQKISGILADLCQQRELWSFIHAEHTQYVLLEAGELKRGPKIDAATKIMRNNKPVVFGTEETPSLVNNIYGLFQTTITRLNPISYLPRQLFDFLPELSSQYLHQVACTLTAGMIAHAMSNMTCAVNNQNSLPRP